jgi:hypothetical protein
LEKIEPSPFPETTEVEGQPQAEKKRKRAKKTVKSASAQQIKETGVAATPPPQSKIAPESSGS